MTKAALDKNASSRLTEKPETKTLDAGSHRQNLVNVKMNPAQKQFSLNRAASKSKFLSVKIR